MPELPEVETVRRGLAPHLIGAALCGARVRETRLRWPVPSDLDARLRGRQILALERRGKYLIMQLDEGALLLHLGMSGSLRLLTADSPPDKHDHVDLLLDRGAILRYHDPRRFGAMLWCSDAASHPLLTRLGMEPLTDVFDGVALYALSRERAMNIKALLMDASLVVGIGNIYANEALFHAGIDPRLPAGRASRPRCNKLVDAVKETLTRAIAAGGSSLRDFVDSHGNPGYFQQTYFVYGRTGEPCRRCSTPIRHIRQGARSSFFCPICQKK